MPRLPLNIGLPLLLVAIVFASAFDIGPEHSVALVVVIILALWTAYSLVIGSSDEIEHEHEENTPALDDPDPTTEEPLRPLTAEEQKELEHEAERHRPLRKP